MGRKVREKRRRKERRAGRRKAGGQGRRERKRSVGWGVLGPTNGLFNIPCRGTRDRDGGGSGLSNYGIDSLGS